MQTVRTTIRIRKDLWDQSRRLALRQGTSLQNVINDTLAHGFGTIADIDLHRQAMAKIDKLRKDLEKKGKKANVMKLIEENKKELQARTDRVLGISK